MMTHIEMIEAAAEALRTVVANRSGRGRAWKDLPERLRVEYRAEASAVLQAVGIFAPVPAPAVHLKREDSDE
jgi:hypothetical protein